MEHKTLWLRSELLNNMVMSVLYFLSSRSKTFWYIYLLASMEKRKATQNSVKQNIVQNLNFKSYLFVEWFFLCQHLLLVVYSNVITLSFVRDSNLHSLYLFQYLIYFFIKLVSIAIEKIRFQLN